MKPTKFDIFRSYFSPDKHSYWWNKFTDYELELSRMSLTELASELNRTKVRNEAENSIIVEHMLAARLARIQASASWWSGWLSFAGAMLAAALTFYLGQLSVTSKHDAQVIPTASDKAEERPIEKPVYALPPRSKQRVSGKFYVSDTKNTKLKKFNSREFN